MQQECTNCQQLFTCAIEQPQACWCAQLPPILPIETAATCLCPSCLKQRLQEAVQEYAAAIKTGKQKNEAPKYANKQHAMQEGIDYYMENGLLVMSGWHHLKRGYCCGSGCRHCPY